MFNLRRFRLSFTLLAAMATFSFAQPIKMAPIAVLGKVARPGNFSYRQTTVSGALVSAGGIAKDGDPTRVRIRRGFLLNPAKARDLQFNYERVKKLEEPDMPLSPGDVIE